MNEYSVTPNKDVTGWFVKLEDAVPSTEYVAKDDAIEKAEQMAKDHKPSKVIILDKDHSVLEERTF